MNEEIILKFKFPMLNELIYREIILLWDFQNK